MRYGCVAAAMARGVAATQTERFFESTHAQSDLAQLSRLRRVCTDGVDGFLKDTRYFIHDRDPRFTAASTAVLEAAGVETNVRQAA